MEFWSTRYGGRLFTLWRSRRSVETFPMGPCGSMSVFAGEVAHTADRNRVGDTYRALQVSVALSVSPEQGGTEKVTMRRGELTRLDLLL